MARGGRRKKEEEDDERDDEFELGEEDEDEEESEGWLASYSDLVTDLMAIFVLLLSFAMLAQGKARELESNKFSVTSALAISAFQSAPQTTQVAEEGQEREALEAAARELGQLEALSNSMLGAIEAGGLEGQVSVLDGGEGAVLLRMADQVLFKSGSSDVGVEAQKVLESIAAVLQEHRETIGLVQIEGHTDDRPINNARFDSNWELSADRAVKVLKVLLEKTNFEHEIFAAAGYGEHHPIAENDTEAGREKNRRVDFIIRIKRQTPPA